MEESARSREINKKIIRVYEAQFQNSNHTNEVKQLSLQKLSMSRS